MQHSHRTERTVRIQSDQRKSVWTLRVMQFDVPNLILTSQSNLPGRGAVGWSRPSPRDAGTSVGTWVGMCAALFVCNRPTGRGTRPGHACGDAPNNTTEPPAHDRVRRCLCVLLPRPRPANLAGRCGIPKTRDNEGVSQKQFRVRDHLRDITRHHVIVVTKFVADSQVGHPIGPLCAWLALRHPRSGRRWLRSPGILTATSLYLCAGLSRSLVRDAGRLRRQQVACAPSAHAHVILELRRVATAEHPTCNHRVRRKAESHLWSS